MVKHGASIIEIAKMANVSIATVSRVCNGSSKVKESTRQKVQAAIDTLGYVPNIGAKVLEKSQSMNIGVVVPSLYNMYFAEVLNGIEDYLRDMSYFLMLSCAKNEVELEEKCIKALIAQKVMGVIVLSPNTENFNAEFYREVTATVPLVFVNAYKHVPGASYVNNDEKLGIQDAVNYLFSLGHKKILFVRGINSDSYTIKEETFKSMMKSEQLDPQSHIINIEAGNTSDTVELTTDELLKILPDSDFTAILCCNDLMAIGALNACKILGKNVPGDISIMGYDNTIISNFFTPKITSVDQNMSLLGRTAASVLIDRINDNTPKKVLLYNQIVERDSTGPARV